MKQKIISNGTQKVWILVFDKGDEFISAITDFAKQHHLSGSHFTAIGAFSEVELGFFDREKKAYEKTPLHEQVEVVSLVGDIAVKEDVPRIHAHVVVARRDGRAYGGHILSARVWPTLEVVVSETPADLRRHSDPETGLALIGL